MTVIWRDSKYGGYFAYNKLQVSIFASLAVRLIGFLLALASQKGIHNLYGKRAEVFVPLRRVSLDYIATSISAKQVQLN